MPDLIILDVTMPDIDGYELLRFFKTRSATKEIKTVLCSVAPVEQIHKNGATEYADRVLQKPFSSEDYDSIFELFSG